MTGTPLNPLQEKLADLELKIAALETAADPEALFLSYIDEALDDACSPPAIVVGEAEGRAQHGPADTTPPRDQGRGPPRHPGSQRSSLAGNLVGVDGLDDIEQADDVVTLGDVLGEHCSEVNADCGKVLAEIYQGLVLPYW